MYSRIPSPPPRRMAASGGRPSYMRPRPPRPDLRVPFNYSGNAFSSRMSDGDRLTALPHTEPPDPPPESPVEPAPQAPPKKEEAPPWLPLGLNLSHFPFGHGLGFEELLLLGLIFFLLKEGETQTDRGDLDQTVILLALLLFCG